MWSSIYFINVDKLTRYKVFIYRMKVVKCKKRLGNLEYLLIYGLDLFKVIVTYVYCSLLIVFMF